MSRVRVLIPIGSEGHTSACRTGVLMGVLITE